MDIVPGETRTHRRTMRDLVALTALPAVWAGYRSPQVAEGLADVLLTILRLDLVYLRLPAPIEGQEIQVARTGGRPATPDQARDGGRALTPGLDAGSGDPRPLSRTSQGAGRSAWSSSPSYTTGKTGSWSWARSRQAFPAKKTVYFSAWPPTRRQPCSGSSAPRQPCARARSASAARSRTPPLASPTTTPPAVFSASTGRIAPSSDTPVRSCSRKP